MQERQIITPLAGINSDLNGKLMPENVARWMKNSEIMLAGNGIGTGSTGVITPSQSNYTNFPTSLLPRTKTYRIDFSGVPAVFYSWAYSKDGQEIVTNTEFNTNFELDTYWIGQGFTWVADRVYEKTSDTVYQYVSYFPSHLHTAGQFYLTFTVTNVGDLVGTNLCIGSYYDRKLNQFFWYNYNTAGQHNIQMYNATTAVYQTVVQSTLIPCDYDSRIGNNVDLVQATTGVDDQFVTTGRLNYFCSETKFPSKINIDRCLSGEYWNNFPLQYTTADQWLRAVKYPPFQRPTIALATYSSVTTNYIQRAIFQFRTRYYYDDGEYSKYSPISILAVPVINSSSTNEPNYILLSNMEAGSEIVTHVEIDYRIGNTGDWRNYQALQREDIINNVLYNYNIVNNTFDYSFYNDRAWNIVDQVEATLHYDNHPIQAGAQEFATNNTIIYGNILEGYDNLPKSEIEKTSVTVAYANGGNLTLDLSGSIPYSFKFEGIFNTQMTVQLIVIHEQVATGLSLVVNTYLLDSDAPASPISIALSVNNMNLGDRIYIKVGQITVSGIANELYLGSRTFAGNYLDIITPLPCGTGDFSVSEASTQTIIDGDQNDHIEFNTIVSDTCNTWSVTLDQHTCPNSGVYLPQLKQGGEYQLGILLYDEALRQTFVQTWDGLDIKLLEISTQYAGVAGNKIITLTFNWGNILLPDWVKYVSVVRTKNKLIDRSLGLGYIQWLIKDIQFLRIDGTVGVVGVDNIATVNFKIADLDLFNQQYYFNTTTNYSFTTGDRIKFIQDGGYPFGVFSWYDGGEDFELHSEDSITFSVDYDSRLSGLIAESRVELYTPSPQSTNNIFYEISNLIPTTGIAGDNRVSVTTTSLNTYDTYFIQRYIPNTDARNVQLLYESPSAFDSKLVPSNGEDIGRGDNVVNITGAQLWKASLARFSFVYTPDTFINGLSTFNPDRKKLYPQQNGKIKKLFATNKFVLHVIQEDNVLYSTIGRQVITLADGTQQLAAASTIISDPIDTQGDYGCQDGETFIEKDGLMHYWDLKRGVVVQYDGQVQKPISREGLASYYLLQSEYIRKNRSEGLCKIQIQGGFDPKRNKYYLTSFKRCPSIYGYDMSGVTFPNAFRLYLDGHFYVFGYLTTIEALAQAITDLGFEATVTGNIITLPETCANLGSIEWRYVPYNITVVPKPPYATPPEPVFTTVYADIYINNTHYYLGNASFFGHVTTLNNLGLGHWVAPGFVYGFENYGQLTYGNWFYNDASTFVLGGTIQVTINTTIYDIENVVTLQDLIDGINALGLCYCFLDEGNDRLVFLGHNAVNYITDTDDNTWITYAYFLTYRDPIPQQGTVRPSAISTCTDTPYIDLSEQMTVQSQGTYAWNIGGGFWESNYGFTPEYYGFIDAGLDGNYMVTFKEGVPYFHNNNNATDYLIFYGDNTDNQYITIVGNKGQSTTKNFFAVGIDSKIPTNYPSGVKYKGLSVTTSNGQTSIIPIGSFKWKEGYYFSQFFGNTSTGKSHINGEKMKGEWIQINFQKDSDLSVKNSYNEFSKIIFIINKSEITF